MDRWIFWPAFASLGIVFTLTLLCELPGRVSFVMIPISLLVYAVTSIVLITAAVIYAAKKRPRRAASFLFVLLTPVFLWSPINWVADCVHLGLTVGFGAGQLGSSSKPDGRAFATYDWSVGLAGGPNTVLIHDETGQIALPMAAHPSIPDNEFGELCVGKVRHLLGHYYVCTF
jgi:hypothetical protein